MEDGRENVCFEQVAEEWMQHHREDVKVSTWAHYRQLIRRHVLPDLGPVPLREMNREKVDAFLRDKLRSGRLDGRGGLAPKTVADIRAVVMMVLSYARENERDCGVQGGVFYPRIPRQHISVLSPQEQKQLEQVLFSGLDPLRIGVICALHMGLRIGEVCALKWQDVLLDQGVVHVCKTMQRVQMETETARGSTQLLVDKPKTDASVRFIPIPSFLLQPLRRCRRPGDCFVLTGEARPMEPRLCLSHYKRMLKKAGLQDYTFHALRHTFATRCVESGFDVKSLSEILGHTHVNITLQRYVHPSMEMKKRQMERLSEHIGASRMRIRIK